MLLCQSGGVQWGHPVFFLLLYNLELANESMVILHSAACSHTNIIDVILLPSHWSIKNVTKSPSNLKRTILLEASLIWVCSLSFSLSLSLRLSVCLCAYAGQLVYSGWLLKKGGSGVTPRNWRRRWFVVRDDCIAYYYAAPSVSAVWALLGKVVCSCNYHMTVLSGEPSNCPRGHLWLQDMSVWDCV